jgi:hypothetical protein
MPKRKTQKYFLELRKSEVRLSAGSMGREILG